jgi:hypothetical protein
MLMNNSLKTNKKFILLINQDEKINRNVMNKIKKLSKNNQKFNFYYMYNSPENEIFLKENFDLEFKKYPQMIIYKNKNKNKNINNSFNKNINRDINSKDNDFNNIENLKFRFDIFPEKALLSYNIKFEELNGLINNFI